MRVILSILLLPFMVVFVVPAWLLTAFAASDHRWAGGALLVWLPRLAGGMISLAGCALFGWCVSLFARVGQGTLAPWDPTRKLVAVGPYRHVRNPMISGVAMMLFGQALFWGSWVVGAWACLFVAVNQGYFISSEEPGLLKRFREDYQRYRAHVPRWVPRLKPWQDE